MLLLRNNRSPRSQPDNDRAPRSRARHRMGLFGVRLAPRRLSRGALRSLRRGPTAAPLRDLRRHNGKEKATNQGNLARSLRSRHELARPEALNIPAARGRASVSLHDSRDVSESNLIRDIYNTYIYQIYTRAIPDLPPLSPTLGRNPEIRNRLKSKMANPTATTGQLPLIRGATPQIRDPQLPIRLGHSDPLSRSPREVESLTANQERGAPPAAPHLPPAAPQRAAFGLPRHRCRRPRRWLSPPRPGDGFLMLALSLAASASLRLGHGPRPSPGTPRLCRLGSRRSAAPRPHFARCARAVLRYLRLSEGF